MHQSKKKWLKLLENLDELESENAEKVLSSRGFRKVVLDRLFVILGIPDMKSAEIKSKSQ